MERSGQTPPSFRRASWSGGSSTRGAPTAAAERHRCWTTAGHMYVLVCIWIHLVSECVPTRRLPPTSQSLAGWPGGCRERGTCAAVSIIFLGSCSGGSLAGRTAASAGSCWACWRYKNALLRLKNALLCRPSLIPAGTFNVVVLWSLLRILLALAHLRMTWFCIQTAVMPFQFTPYGHCW